MFILAAIILVAAFLRLYRYDFADVITDEVFYGYRSIGLVDSLNSPQQPTPFEWYETVPAWARLSFHDHPPLGFWLQHISFKIFGINLLGMRAPFILAGIFSVLLVYFIAKRLFQKHGIALVAAAILSVNNYHVWVSRTGVQESLVIVFQLLAILLFLKTLENRKWFYPAIAVVGAAILMKYTSVVLLPVFFLYVFWKHRDMLTVPRLILGSGLLLLILSPVIIYNLKLYQTRGHFDYQLSYFLGQDVADWQVRPGREMAGGFTEKFTHLLYRFYAGYGLIFTAATVAALLALYRFAKRDGWSFLGLFLGFNLLLLFAIGAEERFLPVLAPGLAILIAAAIVTLARQKRALAYFLIIFLGMETAFTVNTYFVISPAGKEIYGYSKLRRDSNAWGYNQLEEYLNRFLSESYPVSNFPVRFEFIRQLQEQARNTAKQMGKKPRSVMFVADSTMYGASYLWYITRRTVYDNLPILSDNAFLAAIKEDPDYFARQGMEEIYFIKAADTLTEDQAAAEVAAELENLLLQKQNPVELIKRPDDQIAFRIYQYR